MLFFRVVLNLFSSRCNLNVKIPFKLIPRIVGWEAYYNKVVVVEHSMG